MRRTALPLLLAAIALSACGGGGGGAGGGESAQAPAAEAPLGPPVQVAGLTGDPTAGRRVFGQCRSCHVLAEGENRVGPSLYRVVGRRAGTVPGFRYSEANRNSGWTWTEDQLFAYLEAPRRVMPGTTMSYAGLRDPQARADLIAYLRSAS